MAKRRMVLENNIGRNSPARPWDGSLWIVAPAAMDLPTPGGLTESETRCRSLGLAPPAGGVCPAISAATSGEARQVHLSLSQVVVTAAQAHLARGRNRRWDVSKLLCCGYMYRLTIPMVLRRSDRWRGRVLASTSVFEMRQSGCIA